MGIYKRADSPYYWMALARPAQASVKRSTLIPVDGGTSQRSRRNRQLAQEVYAAAMADLARERYQLPTAQAKITFREYRHWYETHYTAQKRGQYRERSILRQLGRHFDDRCLHEITREDIIEWRTRRGAEKVAGRVVSPGTVGRDLQVLRHLLGTAVPKYLSANPAAGVKEPQLRNLEPRVLTRHEEERLLAHATAEERALVVCALDTLQRLSDVVGLRREQDHGDHITVLEPKTGKSYKVPVSTRLRNALDALPGDGPCYFSWADRPTHTRRNLVIRVFQKLCHQADIPCGRRGGGVTFHCLRHTGASRMLVDGGVDMETVRQIGGWSSYRMLQRYVHPTDAARLAAVEAIGNGKPTE